MTRRSFLKGILLGAGGLLFYAAARKLPLPKQWAVSLRPGVKGLWEGDVFVLHHKHKVVRLNTTAGEVAEILSNGRYSVSQLSRALSKKYGISRTRAERDVQEVLTQLDRLGFLV